LTVYNAFLRHQPSRRKLLNQQPISQKITLQHSDILAMCCK